MRSGWVKIGQGLKLPERSYCENWTHSLRHTDCHFCCHKRQSGKTNVTRISPVVSLSTRQDCNAVRYRPGDPQGHYESYFQRANHPGRPLAFWIRYTIFSPRRQPNAAAGELWAVYFDGEAKKITAARDVFPIERCRFSPDGLGVNIAGATLSDGVLAGSASGPDGGIVWNLRFEGGQEPLLLLPRKFYDGSFPRAKSLVGTPNAHYSGRL